MKVLESSCQWRIIGTRGLLSQPCGGSQEKVKGASFNYPGLSVSMKEFCEPGRFGFVLFHRGTRHERCTEYRECRNLCLLCFFVFFPSLSLCIIYS